MLKIRKTLPDLTATAFCVAVTASFGFAAIISSEHAAPAKLFMYLTLLSAEFGIIRQAVHCSNSARIADETERILEEAIRIDTQRKQEAGKLEMTEMQLPSGRIVNFIIPD